MRVLAILTVVACIMTGSAQANTHIHTAWPKHHALWGCIAHYESGGDPHNPGNGSHFGYLAMSWGWLGLISGNPSTHSQMEQEWAAEIGYRNSGYSYSFLYGQWFEWDYADGCVRYA